MKTFYCPLCGTQHTAGNAKLKTVCKCGKTLEVTITDKETKIKIHDVTWADFKN